MPVIQSSLSWFNYYYYYWNSLSCYGLSVMTSWVLLFLFFCYYKDRCPWKTLDVFCEQSISEHQQTFSFMICWQELWTWWKPIMVFFCMHIVIYACNTFFCKTTMINCSVEYPFLTKNTMEIQYVCNIYHSSENNLCKLFTSQEKQLWWENPICF